MKFTMRNFCMNCGTEQGYAGPITSYIYCERCGAKINVDGSVEYDGSREGIQQSEENKRFYDSGYNDREKWKRN